MRLVLDGVSCRTRASTVDDVAGELSMDSAVASTTSVSSICELSDVVE